MNKVKIGSQMITPQETIRMIEAFLTAFRQKERTAKATQIYNAMFTIGYRYIPATERERLEVKE